MQPQIRPTVVERPMELKGRRPRSWRIKEAAVGIRSLSDRPVLIGRQVLMCKHRTPRRGPCPKARTAGLLREMAIQPNRTSRGLSACTQNQALSAAISKPAPCLNLRHSFAPHLLIRSDDIQTVQERLGHLRVRITMIYTHVLNRGGQDVQSSADLRLKIRMD